MRIYRPDGLHGHLYPQSWTAPFKEQYGHLFSDGLAGDSATALKKDEDGMTFMPVPEGGKIV